MICKSFMTALAALAVATLSTEPLQAATITFDDVGISGFFLSQNCCDVPGLDLSFRGVNSVGNGATAVPSLTFWRSGTSGYSYGDLGDVAYVGPPGVAGEIRFDVQGSNTLTLNSIDFGSGQGIARSSQVNIFDLSYNLLFSSSFTVPASGRTSVLLGNFSDSSGLILQFGPDGYEVAIDNIRYDLNPFVAGVPESASWGMMIIGFAIVGGAMRRAGCISSHRARDMAR